MSNKLTDSKVKAYLNPYLCGLLLGIVLVLSYFVLGTGVGASSGIARLGAYCELIIAPARTLASQYFGSWGRQPLKYYLVFMFGGIFFGGMLSALLSGRCKVSLEKGKKCSSKKRILLVLFGGILVGFSSRIAGGCTSGQALSGSSVLVTGSMIFLVCIFIGGYSAAWFVRRQWHD